MTFSDDNCIFSPVLVKSSSMNPNKIPVINNRLQIIDDMTRHGGMHCMIDLSRNRGSISDEDAPIISKIPVNLDQVMKQFNAELYYVKSGSTGHTFKAKSKDDNDMLFAMKVAAYPVEKSGRHDIDNMERPQNVELLIIALLARLVMRGETPHIVLPYWTFNVPTERFANIPLKLINRGKRINVQYQEFVKEFKNDMFDDESSVLISEWCDKGDMLDYIRENYAIMTEKEWKIMLFQVLITLSKIHARYPSFKHNDLKANNILLQSTHSAHKNHHYRYQLNDTVEFVIPEIGYQIKLWDFDFACVKNMIDNEKVEEDWARDEGINSKTNQYYDMHYFLQCFLTNKIVTNMSDHMPKSISDFLHRIVPVRYRSVYVVRPPEIKKKSNQRRKRKLSSHIQTNPNLSESGRMLTSMVLTTPTRVLETDPLFAPFRRTIMKR